MKGYVICLGNPDGTVSYLARGLWWYDHESSSSAWVFSKEEFEELKTKFNIFVKKPTHYFEAEYDGHRTIVGHMSFFD